MTGRSVNLYWIHHAKSCLSDLPPRLLRWAAFRVNPWKLQTHADIKLTDLSWRRPQEAMFRQKTEDALSLIARADCRRYRRVVQQIRSITNENSLEGQLGGYRPFGKNCAVDFSLFDFSSSEKSNFSLKLYATVLVHEATHGHLLSKHIPYTRRTYQRVERLCVLESIRFAKRFVDSVNDWSTILWTTVEVGAWDRRWAAGFFKRLKDRFQRVLSVMREKPK